MRFEVDWIRRTSWQRHVAGVCLFIGSVGVVFWGCFGIPSILPRAPIVDEVLMSFGAASAVTYLWLLVGWIYGLRVEVVSSWGERDLRDAENPVEMELRETRTRLAQVVSQQEGLRDSVSYVLARLGEVAGGVSRLEVAFESYKRTPPPPVPPAERERVEERAESSISTTPKDSVSDRARFRSILKNFVSYETPPSMGMRFASMESGGSATAMLNADDSILREIENDQGTFVLFPDEAGTALVFPNPRVKFRHEVAKIFPHLTSSDYQNVDQFEPCQATSIHDGVWRVRRAGVADGRRQ
jgi:hypothetical protein